MSTPTKPAGWRYLVSPLPQKSETNGSFVLRGLRLHNRALPIPNVIHRDVPFETMAQVDEVMERRCLDPRWFEVVAVDRGKPPEEWEVVRPAIARPTGTPPAGGYWAIRILSGNDLLRNGVGEVMLFDSAGEASSYGRGYLHLGDTGAANGSPSLGWTTEPWPETAQDAKPVEVLRPWAVVSAENGTIMSGRDGFYASYGSAVEAANRMGRGWLVMPYNTHSEPENLAVSGLVQHLFEEHPSLDHYLLRVRGWATSAVGPLTLDNARTYALLIDPQLEWQVRHTLDNEDTWGPFPADEIRINAAPQSPPGIDPLTGLPYGYGEVQLSAMGGPCLLTMPGHAWVLENSAGTMYMYGTVPESPLRFNNETEAIEYARTHDLDDFRPRFRANMPTVAAHVVERSPNERRWGRGWRDGHAGLTPGGTSSEYMSGYRMGQRARASANLSRPRDDEWEQEL